MIGAMKRILPLLFLPALASASGTWTTTAVNDVPPVLVSATGGNLARFAHTQVSATANGSCDVRWLVNGMHEEKDGGGIIYQINVFHPGLDVAKEVAKAGASAVTVHGRYREQMYAGTVDREEIRAVRDAVDITLIANGDVRSLRDYERMIEETGADGVMIGRGALGHYSLFAEIAGITVDRTPYDDIMLQIEYLKKLYPERVVVNLMKHHVCAYAAGRAGVAKEIREKVHMATTYDELMAVVDGYFR